jgi:hypothetical protein
VFFSFLFNALFVQSKVQVHQLWLLLCVSLTLIDTSNHKAQSFSALSMETKPERHRHDSVHEEGGEDDATMAHGALSLHHRGAAALFGPRHDEEAAGRRGEIREVDFFSRDSGARRQQDDGGGRRVPPGGGRDDVNVSHLSRSRPSASIHGVACVLIAEKLCPAGLLIAVSPTV